MQTLHVAEGSSNAVPGSRRWPPLTWLLLGIVLSLMTSTRWSVDVLTWIAPIPFLYYLRHTTGLASRAWFLLALATATTLALVKISADDLDLLGASFILRMGALSAVPVAVVYLVWDYLRRRTKDSFGIYIFPALYVMLEWYHSSIGSIGSWGGLANTQIDNLALLQIASVLGVGAVTFLIAWVAALLELLISTRDFRRWRVHASVLAAVFVAVHVFGSVRLYGAQPGERVQAAAVIRPQQGLPAPPETDDALEYHIEKTREAAQRGAQLVVWSEAAVKFLPERQEQIKQRLAAEARRLEIVLVATFGVDQGAPRHVIDNKFVMFTPTGELVLEYSKHVPVPGERALRGEGPILSAATPLGTLGGAICYDYDFPWIGRALARTGAGLAVAPAADWAGINPLHTKMARFRAIEGGYSLLRSTHRGPSAAFDAYGRILAWLPFAEANERVMMATLPSAQVFTLYTAIGDVFSYACLAWLLFVVIAIGRNVRRDS